MGTPLLPSVDSVTKQFPDMVRARIAANLSDGTTPEGAAIDELFSGLQTQTRQFVYFGDSWGTQLYNGVDPLPVAAIGRLGGRLVQNYATSGAVIGPTTQNSGNTTDAQVSAAQADTSYNKGRVTDVIVVAGVNNVGGYLPTVDQARAHFQNIASLYPNARLWYAANAKKAINNAGDSDPWRWYSRLFEGASLAGYAVADFSPMWTWSAIRTSAGWWDSATSTDSSRHPTAAGFAAVAARLAGFLTGQLWRPYFKVPTALHQNAAALMAAQGVTGTPTIATDDTTVDGAILRLNVSIGGMDALAAVPTSAYQPILQIPTGYMPIGNYLLAPAGCRLSGGTMDFTYALRVNADGAGVVSVDPRLLNNHVGYFVLRADLPLNMVKTAD